MRKKFFLLQILNFVQTLQVRDPAKHFSFIIVESSEVNDEVARPTSIILLASRFHFSGNCLPHCVYHGQTPLLNVTDVF